MWKLNSIFRKLWTGGPNVDDKLSIDMSQFNAPQLLIQTYSMDRYTVGLPSASANVLLFNSGQAEQAMTNVKIDMASYQYSGSQQGGCLPDFQGGLRLTNHLKLDKISMEIHYKTTKNQYISYLYILY